MNKKKSWPSEPETKNRQTVTLGLSHIKNLSAATMERLATARPDGGYRSLDQVLTLAKVGPAEAETLALSGALGSFGLTRPEALWRVRLHYAGSKGGGGPVGQAALPGVEVDYSVPPIPEYRQETILALERAHFGFMLSAHPAALVRPRLGKGVIFARDLPEHVGKEVKLVGWLIHAKRTRTHKGEFMKFLTLEDETAIYEATLFPKTYRKVGRVLTAGKGPYLVTGKVEDDHGDVTLLAANICLADHEQTARPIG